MSWPLLRPVLKAPRLSLLPGTERVAVIASCLADLASSAASAPKRVRWRHLFREYSQQLQAPRLALHGVRLKHGPPRPDCWQADPWAASRRASI